KIAKTGQHVNFKKPQEQTIAFRTDIDALPDKEDTNLSFASKHEGYMHACVHDGHMAMLLWLTDFITKHIEDLIYNVV
ncbi:M20/M25/M40 family metallo-hydrolase, partial [Enterococcus faecium]|uniref:M20/M25/M40 family metallo-hydrolase n=1 Tax=Enterococcus faecium TaxID=1352 RepID=UPI003CC6961E